MEAIARLSPQRPAELFGLAARKGGIEPRKHADFVLFDVHTDWIMSADDVQVKVDWFAHEGWTYTGRGAATVRRGEVVHDARSEPYFGASTGRWLTATAVASASTPAPRPAALA